MDYGCPKILGDGRALDRHREDGNAHKTVSAKRMLVENTDSKSDRGIAFRIVMADDEGLGRRLVDLCHLAAPGVEDFTGGAV